MLNFFYAEPINLACLWHRLIVLLLFKVLKQSTQQTDEKKLNQSCSCKLGNWIMICNLATPEKVPSYKAANCSNTVFITTVVIIIKIVVQTRYNVTKSHHTPKKTTVSIGLRNEAGCHCFLKWKISKKLWRKSAQNQIVHLEEHWCWKYLWVLWKLKGFQAWWIK